MFVGRLGGVAGQLAEGSDDQEESYADADDDADAVEEGLGAGFAAQSFHGLGFDLRLKCGDLRLLVGNLFLLIGEVLLLIDDLLFIAGGHRRLPVVALLLGDGLTILLDRLVAGVSGIPNQTMRFGTGPRIGGKRRRLGRGLHARLVYCCAVPG